MIDTIAKALLAESQLWTLEDLPFSAELAEGHPKVLLVAGENCSGKSFFVECLRSWGRAHHKVQTIQVSIRERVGGGTYEMAGMRRAMMFGDETDKSTGATSAGVVERAFGNVDSRSEEGISALLVLDEPELGMSEGFAAAMGTYIARKVANLPDVAAGVAVVTHSRALGKALAAELGVLPTFVKLGRPQDFRTWVDTPEEHSVEELLGLQAKSTQTWRLVNSLLKEK